VKELRWWEIASETKLCKSRKQANGTDWQCHSRSRGGGESAMRFRFCDVEQFNSDIFLQKLSSSHFVTHSLVLKQMAATRCNE
jgi:hypothetical protein